VIVVDDSTLLLVVIAACDLTQDYKPSHDIFVEKAAPKPTAFARAPARRESG